MNILYEVSKENATVIMVPANIPTAALSPADAAGILGGAEAALRRARVARATK